MDFMKEALGKTPSQDYPVPAGIAFPLNVDAYGRRRPDGILQADWDLFLGMPLKEVCSVDTVPVPAGGNWFARGAPGADFAFNAMASTGAVRVLSPIGETLGVAYLSRDQKGRIELYRDYARDEKERDRPSDSSEPTADWLPPAAGQILRHLRQFVPPSTFGGWFQ